MIKKSSLSYTIHLAFFKIFHPPLFPWNKGNFPSETYLQGGQVTESVGCHVKLLVGILGGGLQHRQSFLSFKRGKCREKSRICSLALQENWLVVEPTPLKNIYICQIGFIFPNFWGENKTYFRNHHRSEKKLANFVGSLFWVQFLTHIIELSVCWWWLFGVIFRQKKLGGDFNPLEKHESNCIIPLSKNKNKTYLKPPPVRKQLHRCAPLPSPINLLSTKFRSADPTLQSRRRATDPEQLRNSFLYLSKKSPTGPTERTPKPEYLIALATSLGVRW